MVGNIYDLKIRQIQAPEFLPVKNEVKDQNSKQSFSDILNEKLKKSESLQFSKHSKERIQQRGINVTDSLIEQLNTAADNARVKGAKDVVMIGREAAFIVNIPNDVVVTAINGSEMKNNIFTNGKN